MKRGGLNEENVTDLDLYRMSFVIMVLREVVQAGGKNPTKKTEWSSKHGPRSPIQMPGFAPGMEPPWMKIDFSSLFALFFYKVGWEVGFECLVSS